MTDITPESQLMCLHGMLETEGLNTRAEFIGYFKMLTREGQVPIAEVASALGYNPAEMKCWAYGANIPDQADWANIRDKLMSLIALRLQPYIRANSH